jgi:hypothetical protein
MEDLELTSLVKIQLGLSKPNPTPYNLRMVDQTIAKPLGLIKDLKIFVDGIPYTLHFFLSIAMYWIIITQCYLDAHG